ncbi:MAG: DinB family protein [Brevefilum sp.]
MQIRIGLEHNIEKRTLAWALDYPGCFAYGGDEPEALIQIPHALLHYDRWIKDHTQEPWVDFKDMDIRVVERFETFFIKDDYTLSPKGEGYEINAWFVDDWRPLTPVEIKRGLTIFKWQRDELLAGLSTLDPELLERQFTGQRWNIIGIAKHIANAELWYLQRLSLANTTRQDLAPDYLDRLAQMSGVIEREFPKFADQVNVQGIDGEFWSYRKILRRILWHQRDHIDHIKQLAFGQT